MTAVTLQHLTVALVYQPNAGVKRRHQDRVAVACLLNGGDGI